MSDYIAEAHKKELAEKQAEIDALRDQNRTLKSVITSVKEGKLKAEDVSWTNIT